MKDNDTFLGIDRYSVSAPADIIVQSDDNSTSEGFEGVWTEELEACNWKQKKVRKVPLFRSWSELVNFVFILSIRWQCPWRLGFSENSEQLFTNPTDMPSLQLKSGGSPWPSWASSWPSPMQICEQVNSVASPPWLPLCRLNTAGSRASRSCVRPEHT